MTTFTIAGTLLKCTDKSSGTTVFSGNQTRVRPTMTRHACAGFEFGGNLHKLEVRDAGKARYVVLEGQRCEP